MARRGVQQWSGWTPLLALVAIVVFVWGLERWRRDASRRAGRSEYARYAGLTQCLLGPDGLTVLRSPDQTRLRLRALAMASPSAASITWLDRCVPLARSLAVHASEVDNTGSLTAAQTRVSQSTRRLSEALTRVALVWRIRAGDPETDMDPIVEQLAQTGIEIELAGAPRVEPRDALGAVAQVPPELPAGALVATPGLEPTTVGRPEHFVAGAALPALAEVVNEGGTWQARALASEQAFVWSVGAAAITRIDSALVPAADGLARLRAFGPDGSVVATARVTPINDPLDGLHVSLAGTATAGAFWLAQWAPWSGSVLARFTPSGDPVAVVLAPPVAGAAARARDPQAGATTALDESTAIARDGDTVLVAFTRRTGPRTSEVTVVASATDSERAAVRVVAQRAVAGRRPGLEFCTSGGRPVLVVAAEAEWLALRVDPDATTELWRASAGAGRAFDERLVLRCDPDGGFVAYAREHALSSPVLACTPRGTAAPRCERVDLPDLARLATMPLYVTRTPTGRALAHGEWPVVIARGSSALLAARASGPVVSVLRRAQEASSWEPDRVVFDAAAHTHGEVIVGLGLYAQGAHATLAAATSEGLHVFVSDDAGASWR